MCSSPPSRPRARLLFVFGIVISWAFLWPAQQPRSLCADEPNDPTAERDEEIYGKFAIGPRTATALDAAVAALNVKIAEFSEQYRRQSDQSRRDNSPIFKPLTAADVVAAINQWDRATITADDETYRLYTNIAKTRTLPPHSLLEIDDQWLRRGKHEVRTCRINLEAMTGKNRGYSFIVREIELDQRPCPRPGYRWLHSPTRKDPIHGWIGWMDGSVKISFDNDEARALVVYAKRPYNVAGLQIVAIDRHQERHDLDCRALGAYEGFLSDQFRLDPQVLSRDKVEFIGVEVVSSETGRERSLAAAERRKNQRVVRLPPPEVGLQYDFSLVADGRAIGLRELRGKVVLIDLWGSWCKPCLKKIPELKQIFEKYQAKGLEIIGISFDDDVDQAQAVIDRVGLPWASVNFPRDSEARKLWTSAIPLTHLPTALLIDRKGVMRHHLVGSDEKLEEKIDSLLSESMDDANSDK